MVDLSHLPDTPRPGNLAADAPPARFVPTLTEVVEATQPRGDRPAPSTKPPQPTAAPQVASMLRRADAPVPAPTPAPAHIPAPVPYMPTLDAFDAFEPFGSPEPESAHTATRSPSPIAWEKYELPDWDDEIPVFPPSTLNTTADDVAAPAGQGALAGSPQPRHARAAEIRALLPEDFEEQLVHRVVQRVDVSLVHRISEVIATVIERQTRSLLPSIREELEFAVRKSVYEAMADELSDLSELASGRDSQLP